MSVARLPLASYVSSSVVSPACGCNSEMAPLLSACYTAQGMGQDMQAAGKGISNSADKNTGYKP